ncbi:tetratricopeptide repeat protein [Parafilimonas sp.]|uniref:tetratricopeptide repeat protein n=1 Tax=Parafilimonas sp. TaxID=1969739 RepID=UPI0039E67318
MRYVPNLIPDNSKVLPDYFKGDVYEVTKKNAARDVIMWLLGAVFFLSALAFIKHPLMLLLFGLIGFILVPPGHKFLEKKLHFRLTPKIKTIAVGGLFLGSIPVFSHYAEIDKQETYQQKLLDEKAAKEKAIAEQKEQQRKDSLAFYIQQSYQFEKAHKIDEANKQLQHALSFASTQADKDQIEKGKIDIAAVKTFNLVKAGKYKAALPEINSLLNSDPSNSELLYNRAICYSKTGKIQEAVDDLKPLIQAGNSEAEKLHDKINPIRKRVAYYVTRCCDGSTSSATGRGACSHHGGVCNWNDPVYEEYRKY